MEAAPQSKHRNLQHRLSPGVKERALEALGAEGSAAGLQILELRQRDMQELFAKIFGVPTKSSNNEWLRSKLLQAVGLPPRWRPAPTPPPSPPRDSCPGEYSRFGRRLRTTAPPSTDAGAASDDDEEQQQEGEEEEEDARSPATRRPAAKRARLSGAPRSGSSSHNSSRGGSPQPQQLAQVQAQAQVQRMSGGAAAPCVPAPAPASDNAAILSLQARAAAAFAAHPAASLQPLVLQPAAAGGAAAGAPMPGVPAMHHPPLVPAVALQAHSGCDSPQLPPPALLPASLQLPAFQLPAPALQLSPSLSPAASTDGVLLPAPTLRSVSIHSTAAPAAVNRPSLADLLSAPVIPPASPAPLLPSSMGSLPSFRGVPMNSCSISAQLHHLFNDWEEGLVSFGQL